MTPTLYFLRSSENKIIENILAIAHSSLENPSIYSEFYGLTTKDLGLYALVDNKIAGAIWSRELGDIPSISFAVLPEFQNRGIGKAMLAQFLQETAVSYESLEIESYGDENNINFLKKFGFYERENSSVLQIDLEKKEIIRPTDNYDPRKWMD
jgi:ribosomal protein S18 acetylase RimI-like enzyme